MSSNLWIINQSINQPMCTCTHYCKIFEPWCPLSVLCAWTHDCCFILTFIISSLDFFLFESFLLRLLPYVSIFWMKPTENHAFRMFHMSVGAASGRARIFQRQMRPRLSYDMPVGLAQGIFYSRELLLRLVFAKLWYSYPWNITNNISAWLSETLDSFSFLKSGQSINQPIVYM